MARYLINITALLAALCFACGGLSLGFHRGGSINRAAATKGQEEIGPIDNYTCTNNGAFPHEECDLFITCWNGAATLHRCTDIMLFDLRYNGCEIAEYVDCEERHRPPTYPGTVTPRATTPTHSPISSTPPPNGTFECTTNGVFPHAQKCEYYWSCYEGSATLIHCEPYDYLFDLRYNGCNFPELTDCQDRERPEGSPSTITPPVTTRGTTSQGSTEPGSNLTSTAGTTTTGGPGGDFQCPRPNGKFPDPEDCSAYYNCVENIALREVCPTGLHFNPTLEICDWPASAGCETIVKMNK